jgi:hypothetical protein
MFFSSANKWHSTKGVLVGILTVWTILVLYPVLFGYYLCSRALIPTAQYQSRIISPYPACFTVNAQSEAVWKAMEPETERARQTAAKRRLFLALAATTVVTAGLLAAWLTLT